MTTTQMAFLLLIFLSVVGGTLFALRRLSPGMPRHRLRHLKPAADPSPVEPWMQRINQVTKKLGRLSVPEEGWDHSGLRRSLFHAGIRSPQAPMTYFGIKTLLALGLPAAAYMAVTLADTTQPLQKMLWMLLSLAAMGYYLPNMVLQRMVLIRQREIFETFPDALDLMTVCVEAGLGVEAALNRVAEDIQHKSEVLAEEMRLVGLELRAGSDRARALRNLAARTGVEEVETWASMLIQADRFGTSIATSLRVHSDMLRTRRKQRAEEAAAKIAVKLLLPLVFCIFPALMLVLMGPAFLQIYRVLLPAMGGTN